MDKNTSCKWTFSMVVIALLIMMAIMLFLRIFPYYHLVFTNWPDLDGKFVNFAQDDAIYHMRLVHNTLHHFPWRIFFDPFTHYPYGNQIHFGYLFTLIIATSAYLIGLGHPSYNLINQVGAYTPTVMGALTILPIYFIGKKLGNYKSGLISAAFLTFISGQFLLRSSLGFADHHVAETLFSSLMMMCLMYAIDAIPDFNNSLDPSIKKRKRESFIAAIMAGISFSAYLLIWPAAILFAGIFFIYFVVQIFINHHLQSFKESLLIVVLTTYTAAIIFSLPFCLVNPRLQLDYFSFTQPLILLLINFIAVLVYFISRYLTYHRKNRLIFFASCILAIGTLLLILNFFVAKFNSVMLAGFKLLFIPDQAMRTVREVIPIFFDHPGHFTLWPLFYEFYLLMPLSFIATIWLTWRAWKIRKPVEILFLVWSLVIFAAMSAQARFSYYYAVNAALLCGFFSYELLVAVCRFKQSGHLNLILRHLIYLALIVIISISIFFPLIPLTHNSSVFRATSNNVQVNNDFFGMSKDWHDALMWLRVNTPDPNLNFDGFYSLPKKINEPYDYPSASYGVMSWWDYGHMITSVAHRIANANPFQKGVSEENNTVGSAPFFVSTNEELAKENLDKLGSRYVVIDNKMANNFLGAIIIWAHDLEGWNNFAKWQRILPGNLPEDIMLPVDPLKYYQTMLYRMYYGDCDQMNHFRLVYESPGAYIVNFRTYDVKTRNNGANYFIIGNYDDARMTASKIYSPTLWDLGSSLYIYSAKPPVADIKIFEKVPGATITGSAPDGTQVSVTILLLSNAGRMFTYQSKTIAVNNHYNLIVPYPTEPMRGENYRYEVTPIGYYTLMIGDRSNQLMVSEWAVIHGAMISIP